MILQQIFILNELIRSQKKEVFNCYDNKADINIFDDSKKIIISLNSMHEPQCIFPHGVQVSTELDSLTNYEPSIYLYDYDYNSTQEISMVCEDVTCSNLQNTQTGMIVVESKTHVTYLQVGSVRVSRGQSMSCFHDDDSYVEVLDGAIVVNLFPTHSCLESIVMPDQVTIKTPHQAQVFIVYNDGSVSVHDPMIIDPLSLVFNPMREWQESQVGVRIKLSRPGISDHFIQSVSNGVVTKAVKKVLVKLYFTTDEASSTPLIKISQTTMNYYKFVGMLDAYQTMSIQLTNDGFITRKTKGALMDQNNLYLQSFGVTSYVAEYIFIPYDVGKTDQFWFRLISTKTTNYMVSDNQVQSSCSTRFPGQGCEQLAQELAQFSVQELFITVNMYYYKDEQIITNYTGAVSQITDSCFSDSVLDYDVVEQKALIIININEKSQNCAIEENDALTVKISFGNGTLIKTFDLDYIPGQQSYGIENIDLSNKPEIRVAFYEENVFEDAVSITKYVLYQQSEVASKSILILIYVLVTNLVFTILYTCAKFLILPLFNTCKNEQKIIKIQTYEQEQLE
ncbi:Conserved_hypothetical protein [Hexamita inflata]|uniref:Uncharacterized protein n=1 Tax=Hexamita inflata TaxID=28002 RepID=A0AA86P4M3_9EUKA|nr:Conserved hypothetical protein [Hexamita inflata]